MMAIPPAAAPAAMPVLVPVDRSGPLDDVEVQVGRLLASVAAAVMVAVAVLAKEELEADLSA